jgi:branched-subunit amino acid aminotransferase/4-amino-4-deoxychorismate lyase
MAGFEGTKWAGKQLIFILKDKSVKLQDADAKVYAVSRSIHYGLFLAFEGIRFFCKKNEQGKIEIIFLNLKKNLTRFRSSISFNLSLNQQDMVPTVEEIEKVLLDYLKDPSMQSFLQEMAELGAQGYLRPFTVDEAQSIGVTFPENPSIRAVTCRYDRYLGEPFSGVVIPNMVRAVGINGTGCLKLGVNYLISVKAVAAAKQILPEAGAALFLDDRPYDPLESRKITEWDSSCCLFALKDGTVIKIPESNLILPSVTIGGICTILRQMGVKIVERDILYGELIEWARNDHVVAICSIGTAGILNRAQKLLLINESGEQIGEQKADEGHDLYKKLGDARTYYWNIYREKEPVPAGMALNKFEL